MAAKGAHHRRVGASRRKTRGLRFERMEARHAPSVDLGFALHFGDTGMDEARDITLDSAGNVYMTGYFQGTVDFDPGPGAANLTSAGQWDMFVAKYTPDGELSWARRFGGSGYEQGRDVAVDADGNVYVAGLFSGTATFDPEAGAGGFASAGALDAFVLKLDPNGSVIWVRQFGGAETDQGTGLELDSSGNLYLTGLFQGTADFDPSPSVFNLTSAGSSDAFLAKLDARGDIIWARRMGGAGYEEAWRVTVDGSGGVWINGSFSETADFDPTADEFLLTSAGLRDAFVAKLDANGLLLWARGLGGAQTDRSYGLAVDGSGHVYATGFFEGMIDFDPGPGELHLGDSSISGFVWKLGPSGELVWARELNGDDLVTGMDVALDGAGDVYITGIFFGTPDFDPGPGEYTFTSRGSLDGFVWKLSAAGAFVWARQMGGSELDEPLGSAINAAGDVYVTGLFHGTADFDPGLGQYDLTSRGQSDVLLVKLSP